MLICLGLVSQSMFIPKNNKPLPYPLLVQHPREDPALHSLEIDRLPVAPAASGSAQDCGAHRGGRMESEVLWFTWIGKTWASVFFKTSGGKFQK